MHSIFINFKNLFFMTNRTFDELMQLKQNGAIGWCELALCSEHGREYLQWCDDHGVEPDDANAELFLEQTENRLYEDGEEPLPVLA